MCQINIRVERESLNEYFESYIILLVPQNEDCEHWKKMFYAPHILRRFNLNPTAEVGDVHIDQKTLFMPNVWMLNKVFSCIVLKY